MYSYGAEKFFYVGHHTLKLSKIRPLEGKLDLYFQFGCQGEMVSLRGEAIFFKCGEISSEKLILQPLRNSAGLIYQFHSVNEKIKIIPHYDSKTGKMMRLLAPGIESPRDPKGNNVNQLLFENAKIIYKTTSELLSEVVE